MIAHKAASRNAHNYQSDFMTQYFYGRESVPDEANTYNDPTITITGPTSSEDSPLIDTGSGYGPFTVTYPSDPEGSAEILVNGVSIGNKPSGSSFYLTEGQVRLGEENKIEIKYKYNKYYAAYAHYVTSLSSRTVTINEASAEAGGAGAYYEKPFLLNGMIDAFESSERNRIWPWNTDENDWIAGWQVLSSHYDEDYGEVIYDLISITYEFQELIRIDWDSEPLEKTEPFVFWPGKPDIKIDLNKVDPSGGSVSGAVFSIGVTGGTVKSGVNSITTSGTNSIVIKPTGNPNQIVVTFTETSAPSSGDYIPLKGAITATFTWNGGQWALSGLEKNSADEVTTNTSQTKNSFSITAVDKQKIKIDILKTDMDNRAIDGIIFGVSVSNGVLIDGSSTVTTDGSGKIHLEIEPTNTSDVSVTLTEKESKYYMSLDPITIIFAYRNGKWEPAVNTTSETASQIDVSGDTKITINIKNTAKIEDLEIYKTNKNFPEEVLEGIQFRITFNNAEPVDRRVSYATGSDGKINIGTIKVLHPSQPVTITLEEINPNIDGVKFKDPGVVTITVTHKTGPISVSGGEGLFTATYDKDNNIINVDAKNIFTIDLSGYVWLDGQTGLKPVKAPDGKRQSGEVGIPDIKVELKRFQGETLNTRSVSNSREYGHNDRDYVKDIVKYPKTSAIQGTVTNGDGKYSFTDIPVRMDGSILYYIEFTFDGIKYIVVPQTQEAGSDSVVLEIERQEFDSKFYKIEKNVAKPKSGAQKTTLIYSHNEDNTEAYVDTSNFTIIATTFLNKYNKSSSDINMGLVAKELDLAAVTDLYKVDLKINGKSHTYGYNDLSSLQKDENGNPIIDGEQYNNRVYPLDLYLSDYNYRIGDYSISNPTHLTDIANYTDRLDKGKKTSDELQITATYQILLNNKSASVARINQIAYYYDTRFDSIKLANNYGGNVKLVKQGIQVEDAEGNKYNKVLINFTNEAASFATTKNQEIIELVFTVGKDEEGYVYTDTLKNYVEITSYTTMSSCIDKNSAPNNIEDGYIENDTDDASGLNIFVGSKKREIEGNVFEDTNIDGIYQVNSDDKVNDVIVQLIELKNYQNMRLEYIWQETVTGSAKENEHTNVRKLKADGTGEESYHIHNEDGEYHFTEIIPGDYIVRFIYGDGTYYDYSIDGSEPNRPNIIKYNGQIYQSTIDPNYKSKSWNKGNENASVARDNESRRLYQITAVKGNDSLATVNSKEALDNTWMCSETSKIDLGIETMAGVERSADSNVLEGTLSFGLRTRDSIGLTLEKHVTQLNVGGTDNIVKAQANINDYYQENRSLAKVNDTNGLIGLKTSYASNRDIDQIGEWFIELPRDDINNKNVEITYTYKILNVGNGEYVGVTLANLLNTGGTFQKAAEQVKKYQYNYSETMLNNYEIGNYLGQAYYTGIRNENAQLEPELSVNVKVEDYTSMDSNQPELVESGSAFKKLSTTTLPIINRDNTDGTETVNVIQSETMSLTKSNYKAETKATVKILMDGTGNINRYEYRSYVAKLVLVDNNGNAINVSQTGRPYVMDNPNYVKAYSNAGDVSFSTLADKMYQYIGETVQVTVTTGGENPDNNSIETKTMNVATIVAGSTAIIAASMILAKKYVFTK